MGVNLETFDYAGRNIPVGYPGYDPEATRNYWEGVEERRRAREAQMRAARLEEMGAAQALREFFDHQCADVPFGD